MPDRNSGSGRFFESERFEHVERLDGPLLSGDLVTTPDDVGQSFLAGGLVDKTEIFGPDFVESNPPSSGDDHPVFGVAKRTALGFEIRILHPDRFVDSDAAVGHGELHFRCIGEKRQLHLRVFFPERNLTAVGEEITTQGNIL